MLNGSTTVIYEGKPVGTPDASAFFRVIDQHEAVGSFWSPTALRIIRQYDPDNVLTQKYKMEKFRSLFVAGEHCDRDTLIWARHLFGKRPVIDHYWQTETGTPMTAVCLGLEKHPVRNVDGKEKDLSYSLTIILFIGSRSIRYRWSSNARL